MINQGNLKEYLKDIKVKELPEELIELHEFVMDATDSALDWEAYNDIGIKPVIDEYFKRINKFFETKSSSKPEKKNLENKITPLPKERKATEKVRASTREATELNVEFVERLPDEIRFIRRYLSLSGKRKSKKDLLLFINALHRAILEKKIRKSSVYAKQISYIQDKLVSKYNSMTKPETLELSAKVIAEFKDILDGQKVMPSVALLKRYISLNGKFGVKDQAKNLIEAMKRANEKSKVKKTDKYFSLFSKMLSNLNSYVKNKSEKILSIEETELNGLQGFLGGSKIEELSHEKEELAGIESTTEPQNKNVTTMSLEEAKRAQFATIGLQGVWRLLIGNACMPTHVLIYGEGGSGKTSCSLKYAEYLNSLGHKILYVAGEQFDTPTFTELLTNLNISGNQNFVLVKDLNSQPLKDFDFVVLDSKDSLDLDVNDFRTLKKTYPKQSFIITSQGTKTGDFTGSGQWRNEVDTMILCEKGVAKTTDDKNRWGGKGEMKIFETTSGKAV